jgi:membrane-bound ClpP family serine protease
MATQKKIQKGGQNSGQNSAQEEREARMPLGRRNYVLMLIGLGMIVVGFLLMAGGGSDDPAVFNERMFSFRRITLAPIVVIAGFAFEIYALMSRKKTK